MANIQTFAQREKAQKIYDTFFDPDSPYVIDFDLFDSLNFYGALTDEDFDTLDEKFDVIGNKLWQEIEKFDKQQLKNRQI